MSNELIKFEFETSSMTLRVIEIDGEPWFVAKDVAEALEYAYWQPNLISSVPDEWKGINPINTPGGIQEMVLLSEQGLYFFVLRSDKPKALPFQKWLAGEVLPTLRKRGFYGLVPLNERMKHHGVLSRTVKQLAGTRDAIEQDILLKQVTEICGLLGIPMPSITLVQKPAAQMKLTTGEEIPS